MGKTERGPREEGTAGCGDSGGQVGCELWWAGSESGHCAGLGVWGLRGRSLKRGASQGYAGRQDGGGL